MTELGKDFIINEFGEIVMLNGKSMTAEETPEHKLQAEHSQLEYEIFSHPDRFTDAELAAKKARYDEIKKTLGMTKKVDALAMGKAILQKRMTAMRGQENASSANMLNIAAQKDRD